MGKAKRLYEELIKKDKWISIKEGFNLFSFLGLKAENNSLRKGNLRVYLPEVNNKKYEKNFINLEINPYMDNKTLKLRITGEYFYMKRNFEITKGKRIFEKPQKISIDTFVEIPTSKK